MATVNYSNPNTDRTVKIFDDFYKFSISVDAGTYDAVYSFFRSAFSDELAAKNFTVNLFQISENSGIDPITLLDEVKDQDQITLTKTFSYYLNNLRSTSTLLGISAVVKPSFYAARNVLS